MNDKKKQSLPPEIDDVGRLFARLGSGGAEGYWDFEPNRLPVREQPVPPALPEPVAAAVAPTAAAQAEAPVAVTAPQPVSSILATIHPLRVEPAPRPVASVAAGTPLADMFQRLLKAESRPVAAGPLRRMFSR